MVKKLILLTLGLGAVFSAGCLQKETSHTLYLSPDGSVRWVAAETGVFSDEEEAAKRLDEERQYISAALTGSHGMSLALKALEPSTLVETAVLRDERPFHVITSAGFTGADRVLQRLFTENGVPAEARLTSDGVRSRLTIELDFTRGVIERESPANVLLEDLAHVSFVLTEGQFIAGGGFEVANRSGRARIGADWIELADRAVEEKRKISLVLAWEVTP